MSLLINPYRYVDGGGGGTWSPSDLADLAGWWDPSELALADGAAVSTLTDKTANGYNLTGAGTTRPVYDTSTPFVSSLPSLHFDGSDDYLSAGDVLDPGAGSFSMFFVMATTKTSAQRAIQKRGTGGFGSTTGWQFGRGSSRFDNIAIDDGAGAYRQVNMAAWPGSDGNPHVVGLLWDAGTDTLTCRADSGGTEVSNSVSSGTVGTVDTTRAFTLGCADDGGARSQFWLGHIGEIIFCNDLLTSSEITEVEGYLSDKWVS